MPTTLTNLLCLMNCLSTLKCLACIPRIARVSRIGLSDGLYSSSLAESAEDNATNKMTIPGHNGAASHQPKGDKNNSKMKKDFKVLMLHGMSRLLVWLGKRHLPQTDSPHSNDSLAICFSSMCKLQGVWVLIIAPSSIRMRV